MVMTRSRSRSMESRNCSVISREVKAPVRSIRRSERVVLPWSMWAMMEKFRMRARSVIRASALPPAPHDQVQLDAAKEEAPALLVQAPGRVVADEAVGQGLDELPGPLLQGLRLGAGHHQRDAAVHEGQEELVVPRPFPRRPGRQEVLHGLPGGQGVWDAEEGRAPLLQELAQDPGPGVRIRVLEDDPFGLQQAGVGTAREPPDRLEEAPDLGGQALL